MGNVVDPSVALGLIQRARLVNGLSSITGQPPDLSPQGQVQTQQPTQAQQGQPPAQGQGLPVQSPRDRALNEYRQALQTSAPNISDYHPSVGRRIVGALLGGIAGIHDPKTGAAVGHGVSYGPYEQQLTDYQRKLAQKKEAFDTEESIAQNEATTAEKTAQKSAEEARAEAESARRKSEEFGISPEGQQFKLKLAQVEHPGVAKIPPPYEINLKNGEKVIGYEDSNGQFKDASGNIYGPDSIDSAFKLGTQGKTSSQKPEREGEAGYLDSWEQEHGRKPTSAERLQLHKSYDTAGRKPEDTSGKDFSNQIKLQGARQSANRPYQRNLDLSTNQLDRIDRAKMMVSTSKPEDIAIAVPEILTALVSGQGTGVRITQPEMNSIISARGWGDSIEALTNKIKGLGNMSDKQKSDLVSLLDSVGQKVGERQKDLSDLMDKIDSSDDIRTIGQAQVDYRKKLTTRNQGNKDQGNKDQKKTLSPEELRKKYGY